MSRRYCEPPSISLFLKVLVGASAGKEAVRYMSIRSSAGERTEMYPSPPVLVYDYHARASCRAHATGRTGTPG